MSRNKPHDLNAWQSNLSVGDQVWWQDPDEGISSGYYTVVSIHSENAVISAETILSLKNEAGSELEAFAKELLPVDPSVFSGGELMMQDVVGDYDSPSDVPEWAWVEQNASYAHTRNGQDGVWEFVLNVMLEFNDIPVRLQPVIDAARCMHLSFLIVHQGT